MTNLDHRPFRTVLIPWVIALVTLIGLNALAPDHARVRKNDPSGEMGLSQLADDAATPGRICSLQTLPAPHPADGIRALCLSSRLVLIEERRGQAVFQALEGAAQGRAPPAGPAA
jgi:hypothetical protein